ncbi:MAG: EF-hand domain-containing protein [Mailhella sp.]|nr:EF-hand domain-containing protein [Mailhella sp.]
MDITLFRGPTLLLVCSLLAASPAYAMPGAGGKAPRMTDPAARFAQMDSDASGSITWEEFHAARPNLNENAFKSIDADKDGGICPSEWTSFSSGHGKNSAKPDMESMMKSMGGMMRPADSQAVPAQPAVKMEKPAAMPLIMPPKDNGAAPKSMPLIMPPSQEK